MNKSILLFSLLFLISVFSNAQDTRKYTTHVVRSGETVKTIAKKYDCKTKDIKNLNPDIDEDNLVVNSTLVVPNPNYGKTTSTEPVQKQVDEKVIIHVVEPGNTIFSIAKKYNVTIQSLKEANHLVNDNLQPGQKLRIPSKAEFTVQPTDKKVEFYQIQKGDTKWRIATLYNISVDQLNSLNPDLQGDDLKEGEYIWVPIKDNTVSEEVKETFQQDQDPSYIYHVVKEGEGLFKIAVIYSTTQEEIEKLNPEAVKMLRPGMLLKIPGKKKDKFITHIVEKGDTFFNLTRRYDVTEEYLLLNNPELKDGLKIGSTIFIKPIEPESDEIVKLKLPKGKSLNISFLMPMMSDLKIAYGEKSTDSQLRTIVADFYLGAQLAIEELERKGLNIEYHVYDTKNDVETLENILENNDVKNSDLIIGPFFFDKAEIVAKEFKDIPVITPLYSKKQSDNHQHNLIKAGLSTQTTNEALANYLVDNYHNQKIILISDFNQDNLDATASIEAILKEHNIPYQNIKPSQNQKDKSLIYISKGSLQNALVKDKESWVILLCNNDSLNAEVISTYGIMQNNSVRLFTTDNFKPYDRINFSNLVNLQWTFASNEFDNLNNENIDAFRENYREKNFSGPPTFAFEGYDLTYDILSRLATGDFINSLENHKTMGLAHIYNYKKTNHSDFVNTGVLIVKLNENYEYEIIN